MMGHSHALTGAAIGLVAAELTAPAGAGAAGLATVAVLATTTAGAALLPDLDHPEATAAHALGPATRALARGVARISATVYAVTRTPRDARRHGGHRTLTHTLVFAVGTGALVLGAASLGPWGAAACLWPLVALALLGVAPRRAHRMGWPVTALLAAAIAIGVTLASGITPDAWRLALAAALGCLVHCLGDALTDSGVPLFFPLPLGGRRWARVGTPRATRFHTGGGVEAFVIVPLAWLALAAAAAWPLIR